MQKTSHFGHKVVFDRATRLQDIQEILAKRYEAGDIVEATLDNLHDPYLMAGMKEAVERVKLAKDQDERVMIFGDYDVDGVTSTSLMMHFFKKIGIQVTYRLPHRVKDGYGLKKYFIDEAEKVGVSLVITVDCGTRDVDVVEYAKSKNIDVIVTDHHAVPDIIPEEAVAIINPKRPDCQYPFKHLAGAGVAFKVITALAYEFLPEDEVGKYLTESIDIAAVGTVADCMKLIGENRTIVQLGLAQIKYSRSRGIRSLLEDKMHEDLDGDVFGFLIGPRLNAAGRMDTPYKAVNLLLNNSDTLNDTLIEIERLNDLRKNETKIFTERAMERVNRDDNLIFYDDAEVEHGIIGIVAGRLTEKFYKPSIVLKDEGEKLVASCRSPEYFSIVELLEKNKDFFLAFGGHKQAAGFSISKEKYPEFKRAVLRDLNKRDFSKFQKEVRIDKIVKLDELGFSFLERVQQYKPYGLGNPKPLFMVENFDYEKLSYLGKGVDHIRFNTKFGFKIFGFFMGDSMDDLRRAKKIDLIFDISEDTWMGKRNLMLKIVDFILEF